MFIKKNLQWWTGLALVCLMLSLVLFAFVARKPLCIDSKIVERIDSVSERGSATAYRCGLHRHVNFDESIASVSRELSRKLQKTEKFLDWLGPLKSKINIIMVSGNGSIYRIQGHEIFANQEILMAQGQLEKAIFKIWFREQAHPSLHDRFLIEEAFTDLIYASYSGLMDIQDPVSKLFLNDDLQAKWPRILTTARGFCRSIWKTMDQLKVCENLQDFSISDEKLDLMSMRPLISQALLSAYQSMPASERMEMIKSLAPYLASWAFDDQTFGMSSLHESQQTFTDGSLLLESWTRFLETISMKFSTLFSNELRARGYQGIDTVADLDILVFAKDLGSDSKASIKKQIQSTSPDLFSGWLDGDQIQMNMNGEPLSVKLFGGIKATRGIYFHCGQPDLESLVAAASHVQRLLFVDSCELSEIKLTGFMKKGTVEFALQNSKTKFVDFHTPSLLAALSKMPGINPIEALASKDKFKSFFQQLGWSQPSYDQSADAYRAQSAIEAIDWYRL